MIFVVVMVVCIGRISTAGKGYIKTLKVTINKQYIYVRTTCTIIDIRQSNIYGTMYWRVETPSLRHIYKLDMYVHSLSLTV